ncbi:MAG: septum formation initiator family protein [Clostridia bacterium]|nr:septum formation initiator family protein [Clostridia bacterium]
MKQKPKKQKSIILRLVVLGVCAYMSVTLINLWQSLKEGKAELAMLQAEYDAQVNDIEELRALLEAESNTQIIEKAARERLGYIYSDEQVFVDTSGS